MLLYELPPGFYTGSPDTKRNRLLYQRQPTGPFSVRPTLQGRDVVVGLTLEQTQSRLCCALFVCSRGSPIALLRTCEATMPPGSTLPACPGNRSNRARASPRHPQS